MKSAPIIGYRDLSDDDIEIVNRIKEMECSVGALWAEISKQVGTDKRWLAIAKTHFQEGFMAFVRSVTQPDDVY